MNNPYEQLYIYYLDGLPSVENEVGTNPSFLGAWEDDDVAFLFFSCPSDETVKRIIDANGGIHLIDRYEMSGEQWHGDKIEPYFIENIQVCPPWEIPDNDGNGNKQVILDPGVVFGTGRHQTTEDCLQLIHRICTRHSIDTVLDIGTGTGLLAMGAASLGCSRVMACDFNRLAVRTTLNNIRLNRFENAILAFQARGEEVMSIPCDLLVANIHYDVMRHMIESPHLLEKKWFILSGLLNSETRKVLDRLSKKDIHIVERRCPDGVWNTILGRPRAMQGQDRQ